MSNYKLGERKEINNKVQFEFIIEGNEWKKSQESALLLIAKNINLPGFRKGKAPIAAIRGAIDNHELFNKAVNIQINTTLKDFVSSTQENFISEKPEIEVKEITENKLVFTSAFESMPTVKLADYKKFDLKLESTEVTQEEVEHEFNRMIKKDTMLIPKENGTVQNGDSLNIDFVGYKDGVAFPGGSAKNQELEIGSNSFIPGFEESLIGMKIGETKSISLSFPKDYHAEDLAGQEVKFDVTVNSISSVEKPEFNEEYLSKFKLDNVKTEQDLKNYLKKQLSDWKIHKAEQDFQKKFSEKLIETTTISYFPSSLVEAEKKKIDEETVKTAEQKEQTKQEYLTSLGYADKNMYEEGLKIASQRNITLVCSIQKIAEELNINVTEQDFDDYYSKVAKLYGMTIEEVKNKYKNTSGVEAFIFQKKTYDELLKFYK